MTHLYKMREKSDLDSIFSRQIKYHSVFIVIRKLPISRNAVVLSYNSETLLHTWIPGTYCSQDEVARGFSSADEVDTRGILNMA